MDNHNTASLSAPPADPIQTGVVTARAPNYALTGPLRSVPPPEPHTLKGPPKQPIALPTFVPGELSIHPANSTPPLDVLAPNQTPKSLRWPQSIIDYLVPVFKTQSQPELPPEPVRVPTPKPEPIYSEDPIVADLLRARAWFRSRAEPVDLQLRVRCSFPPIIDSTAYPGFCSCSCTEMEILSNCGYSALPSLAANSPLATNSRSHSFPTAWKLSGLDVLRAQSFTTPRTEGIH